MKITIDSIFISYQKKILLDNLSMVFESGKLSCLLGSSGSGKTTLLKIIAGVSDPFTGTVLFDDKIVNELSVGDRHVGWVPQQQLLFPGMNVFENIAYGLRARKYNKSRIDERVDEISKLIGVNHLLSRSPDRLSGGERQRVAIARAIAPNPKLLLLDEPFSSLDAPERDKLALIMREVQLITGITTIHVTHSPREAELLADRVHVLANGIIHQSGMMKELRSNPKSVSVAALIGVPNVIINWMGNQSVIIPYDAISISDHGSFKARIISITQHRIYLKMDNYHLEMLLTDKVYHINDQIKINLDKTKIQYF